MDEQAFAAEATFEETHWWFVGRRRLFSREIQRMKLQKDASILDIGTSTGTNLRMLRSLGFENVTGIDPSESAREWCLKKQLGDVVAGDVRHMPFETGMFDLVLATDILEHVDQDDVAAGEIQRVLAVGGYALITVPTFQFLWGLQDDLAHHYRRYRKRQLLKLLRLAGLSPQRAYYFNYLLLIPILVARRVLRIANLKIRSEGELNTPLLNRLLGLVFRVDIATAPFVHPPMGVSALVVVRKESDH